MNLIWVTEAEVYNEYMLLLTFNDGCRKFFDCNILLEGGNALYKPLQDTAVFREITLNGWTVTWNNGMIDVAPEFLYEKGIPIQ